MAQGLGLCLPYGRKDGSSRPLASDWPTLGCCRHLENEKGMQGSPSLFLLNKQAIKTKISYFDIGHSLMKI